MIGTGQTLNPASMKYNWAGEWTPNDVYQKNDVVRHRGRTWFCNTDSFVIQGERGYQTEPSKHNGWQLHTTGQVNRGGWGPHKTYLEGDIVMYAGEWYICEEGGRGIHPVYHNGSLTNKWTKIIPSPRNSQTDRFIPYFQNEAPVGWNKYYNGYGPIQHTGQDGIWLIDWNGMPCKLGYASRSHNEDGSGGNQDSLQGGMRKKYTPGFQFIDFLTHDKKSITGGMPKCIQIVTSMQNTHFLFDNGEVYWVGNNSNRTGGVGPHTDDSYAPTRVGRDWEQDAWPSGYAAGEFRERFIIKLAGGAHGADDDHSVVGALDSEGDVWMWGDNGRGAVGNGINVNGDQDRTDVGLPYKIPRGYFNNKPVVDFWSSNRNGDDEQFIIAINSDGDLFGWGDNNRCQLGFYENDYVVTPQPLKIDLHKHGGLKKILMMPGNDCGTMILTEDNVLHYSGDTNNFFPGFADENKGTNRIAGFPSLPEYFYSLARNEGRSVGHQLDLYRSVGDIWGITSASNEGSTWIIKDAVSGNLYATGRGNDYWPYNRAFGGDRTDNSSMYDTHDPVYYPRVLDNAGLNTEYIGFFNTGTNTGNDSVNRFGYVSLAEDGRCVEVNADNHLRAGLGENDSGGRDIWHENPERFMYWDEKLFADNDNPLHPRGDHHQFHTVHVGNVPGGEGATYCLISSDGTAGFCGEPQRSIERPDGNVREFSNQNNNNPVVNSGGVIGRLRAV